MGWSNDEPQVTKKGMDLSIKILIAIIICVAIIVLLIGILLINIEETTFTITVDGKEITTITKSSLISQIDNVTYFNIEEFAKLVKYEYHEGEYKAFTIEKDKCYVQGDKETATFYLNDNKVCKLPINQLTEEYREFEIDNTVKEVNGKMYATIDAIELAFNVYIVEEKKAISIYTLDELVKLYDNKVKSWGYTGILEHNFENKKSLLYGYLVVKKDGGLYKIIDNDNNKEIVLDKYSLIQFNENTQEFLVTNSLGQVGIINLDGTTKIEPIYESISVYNKESDLYLIQKNSKHGIAKSGNIIIIPPEYDDIGITFNSEKENILLDTLIPVCKNNKWGAFNKLGEKIIEVEYDSFGSNKINSETDATQKVTESVLTIKRCNGIIVNKLGKYGIIDIKGNVLVPIKVDSIYELVNTQNEDEKYYMIYNDKNLNIIERLIKAGLLEDKDESKDDNLNSNAINDNIINSLNTTNIVENSSNIVNTN